MDKDVTLSELAAQPAPKPAGYEFTPAQNLTIRVLAQRMKFIGVLNMAFAVMVGVGGVFMLFQSLPQALVAFVEVAFFAFVGIWSYQGATSFRQIVETRGSDILHLMNALDDLRKIYNLQFWLMIVILGLVAVGIVVALIIAM